MTSAPSAVRGASETERPVPVARRRRRRALVLVALASALCLVALVSVGVGPVAVHPIDTLRVIVAALTGQSIEHVEQALVITELRLPRVAMAILVGAGLAVGGVAMQAYFRNPLADPGVTGVASGAAVGAVTVIVLVGASGVAASGAAASGVGVLAAWARPGAAFAGAVLVLIVIQGISWVTRDRSPATLLLLGIAMNALCGAMIGAIVANAEDSQTVRGALFWLQGDLTAVTGGDVGLATAPILLGITVVALLTRELNALLLGDDIAVSMGIDVSRLRAILLVVTAVMVGSAVAVTGVIGFVGLVAPHVARLLLGSDHRTLLPGSALVGGLFLVAADTVARLGPGGAAWQTGVVTALIGAPVFVVLVMRTRGGRRVAS